MNLSRFVAVAALCLTLCLTAIAAHTQDQAVSDQVVSHEVDWQRGTVSIEIRRPILADAANKPSAISRVQSEIERDAVGIIAEHLLSLTLDSYYTIDEYLSSDESRIQEVLRAASQARPVDAKSSPDLQSALVLFELDLHGDLLAQFIEHTLPESIPQQLGWVPLKEYTGIVIYAAEPLPIHGTDRVELIHPALLPELYYFGDSQREIFLLADAKRMVPEYLTNWGVVRYVASVDERDLYPRVGEAPLRIMAYGGFGRYPTDIVLARSDAEQILSSEANRQLLSQGRIAVALSPSAIGTIEQP